MIKDEFHMIPLRYGKTDGENIPYMPKDKYFAVGYNPKYGLIDVLEDNGDSFFEGRVNIEKVLSELQSVNRENVDSQVEDFIMKSYLNFWDYQNNPEEYASPPTPILEILTNRAS